MIEYRDHITRQMLRDEPDTLFVFGDNMQRRGMGGQAFSMRGEPNAVGIPTKKSPSMRPEAFFSDHDLVAWKIEVQHDFDRLFNHEGKIVWPDAGIGTGRAKLHLHAPKIMAAIDILLFSLEDNGFNPAAERAPQ